jgi:protein TonB
MFAAPPGKAGGFGRVGWSVAAHAIAIAALLSTGEKIRVRADLPGTSEGSRIELTYLPGGAGAAAPNRSKSAPAAATKPEANKKSRAEVAKSVVPPLPTPPAPEQDSAKISAAPTSGQAGAASNDALGTEEIQIALTTYSPSPKPDLSLVPRGTQGDVIVDITIDPTGRVADLQILHALGYGVEGLVAETVRTWKFRPATKDGVPVASVQELHFHFGPV